MKRLLRAFMFPIIAVAPAIACASAEPYLGEIITFAGTFCPRGYDVADGHLLPISQNTELFSLLGTNYGGDGRATFALPNIKPVLAVNHIFLMSCIAVDGIFPPRD